MSRIGRAALFLVLAPACAGGIGTSDDQGPADPNGNPAGRSSMSPGQPGPGATAPGPEGTTPGSSGQPPSTKPPLKCDGPTDAALGLMLRLTRGEYDNTVRDLLGDTTRPAQAFSVDAQVAGFSVNASAPPSESELEQYRGAAESLAAKAVTNLATLLPCTGAEVGTKACADKFIRTFGRRAFRRPLDTEEVQAYATLFDKGMASDGFPFGITLVLRAMLQSPAFLYRAEAGQAIPGRAGLFKLNAWELASRLSYALWRSMPDDELLDAAAGGRLEGAADVAAQIKRMLTTPAGVAKARVAVADFANGWMDIGDLTEIDKDPAKFRTFKGLTADMQKESQAFVQEIMLGADSRIGTLLLAPFSFVTTRLAPLYGVTLPAPSTTPIRVDLPAERSGILTHAGLMSVLSHEASTSPVQRGMWVRTALLCQAPPPPPADVDNTLAAVDPNLPIRQKLAMHRISPACAGCHELMDPIGFAFEHFDPIGAYRTMDGRNPVDSADKLTSTDVDGPFTGVRSLAERLARSAQVQDCMAKQWLRFTLGRLEGAADQCTLATLNNRQATSGGDLKDALTTLVSHESFRYRRTEEVVR